LFVGASFKTTFEIAKQIEIFTTLFKELNTNVDETNPGELMDKAITGMLSSLDPILLFYNEQEVVNFKINNTGEYTGIGALITRKEGKLIIRESTKISPDKAGFKAGDEIIKLVMFSWLTLKMMPQLKGQKKY
jgi:carboxyl-terminal processing protease